jgi:hypothetical protein
MVIFVFNVRFFTACYSEEMRKKGLQMWVKDGGSNPLNLESRARDAMKVQPRPGNVKIYTKEEIEEFERNRNKPEKPE